MNRDNRFRGRGNGSRGRGNGFRGRGLGFRGGAFGSRGRGHSAPSANQLNLFPPAPYPSQRPLFAPQTHRGGHQNSRGKRPFPSENDHRKRPFRGRGRGRNNRGRGKNIGYDKRPLLNPWHFIERDRQIESTWIAFELKEPSANAESSTPILNENVQDTIMSENTRVSIAAEKNVKEHTMVEEPINEKRTSFLDLLPPPKKKVSRPKTKEKEGKTEPKKSSLFSSLPKIKRKEGNSGPKKTSLFASLPKPKMTKEKAAKKPIIGGKKSLFSFLPPPKN